jgi:hypothetical protein
MINGKLVVEWRDTYIYGEQYQVSNTGIVRNKLTGKILKPQKDGKGYLRVSLSKNNVQVTIKVHRAVAMAFIPNPDNLPQVNHKDTNKENNTVSNLEWISNYDNMQHAIKNGLTNHVDNSGRKKRPVIRISSNGENVKFGSLAEASKQCNVSRSNLCNALKGKRNMCGGYRWKYDDESEVAVSD